jgi:hypothetical protein
MDAEARYGRQGTQRCYGGVGAPLLFSYGVNVSVGTKHSPRVWLAKSTAIIKGSKTYAYSLSRYNNYSARTHRVRVTFE